MKKFGKQVLIWLFVLFLVQNSVGIQVFATNPETLESNEESYVIDDSVEYISNRINIKVRDEVSSGLFSIFNDQPLDFSKYGIIAMDELLLNAPQEAVSKSIQTGDDYTWYSATLEDSQTVEDTIKLLQSDEKVIVAEPDYIRSLAVEGSPIELSDPDVNQQWYLDTIDAQETWQYLQENNFNPGGSRDVVIAVIDTGVDYKHNDLSANMWINSREIPNNGIDDDNNGYIDDYYGVNTITGSGNPLDDHGHGTHVSGIIAMVPNNGIGGVGIAFNSRIMAIKAGSASGYFTSSDIAEAINYAVSKGADVINMSFGGYGLSMLEKDALQTAFGTSVLVAAAGNKGICNEGLCPKTGEAMYPASYNFVLGVMAQDQFPNSNGDYLTGFSNFDIFPNNGIEYELMAPGANIYSTLPNNRYAKWSGTSMAAPIVSATAALARTYFSDKSVYSSRFLMGQLASTGLLLQGVTYEFKKSATVNSSLSAFNALSTVPKPDVQFYDFYTFDPISLSETNNANGVVDAGEVIDFAILLRNHWGQANNVTVSLDALSPAGIPNPYVEFLLDTVSYDTIGNFATDDNGIYYENDVMIGVLNPFRVKIAQDTPNDTIIHFNVEIDSTNGLDLDDTNHYNMNQSFELVVRNGKLVPSVIDQDITLTKDSLWIIEGPTLIEKDVTVIVEPGTSIQFYSSNPNDPYSNTKIPYLQVEGVFLAIGTLEEPINIFPSSLFSKYAVTISSLNSINVETSTYTMQLTANNINGNANLSYVNIQNPKLAVNSIDHSILSQNFQKGINVFYKKFDVVYTDENSNVYVEADNISKSIFRDLDRKFYSRKAIDYGVTFEPLVSLELCQLFRGSCATYFA